MKGARLLRTTSVLAATLAVSIPSPAVAPATQEPSPPGTARGGSDAAPQREDRLAVIQQSIERAFIRCDPDPLRGFLARRVKIYVAAGGLGINDGYYSADQMLLLFRRMFDGRSTVRFTLLPAGARSRSGGQARVRALWLYREEGAPESEARISFTLAPESGHWSIREIRELQ
jgi:hypothetical protein